ncbi:hypothetical protein Bra471DRAFT_02383 [Bradyrhizobium sp. WSM471]|nr:hypothetical protein Bra471DRAFT_02383 [Bradyrhizobium sp. WSM471]
MRDAASKVPDIASLIRATQLGLAALSYGGQRRDSAVPPMHPVD